MASVAGPPPGIDLAADQGRRVVSSGIALLVLSTSFVILRFASRSIANAGYWWDDFLVVVSLFLSYGPNIAMMISARDDGFGRHLWALADPKYNTSQFLKILYIYIFFYYAAVVTIKLCILTFYRRIFPVTEIRLWLYVGYGTVICYAIATLCSTTFQCQPIHGFWDKNVRAHCVPGDDILVVPGAVNAVLDGFVILLPLPLLWRLRTTARQKGILTGIFACGAFVCIISVVRLIVLSRLEKADVTWNFVNAAIWSAAEPSMGVIAACIPSLRPLIALLWKGSHRGPTMASKTLQDTSSSSSSKMKWTVHGNDDAQPTTGFARLQDSPSSGNFDRWGHEASIHGGKRKGTINSDEVYLEEMNAGQNGIRVKNEITITSHAWEYKDRLY